LLYRTKVLQVSWVDHTHEQKHEVTDGFAVIKSAFENAIIIPLPTIENVLNDYNIKITIKELPFLIISQLNLFEVSKDLYSNHSPCRP
jgi:hypothetical protein